MNKLLSIIIPTFNMEKYLRKCLSSLLVEEDIERLEVLVINDGSNDSSLLIANEFVEHYPTVFKVINKSNGNYGSCINRGLKEATGKYIKVLDADDSFDTCNFADFLNYLSTIDSDLILSDYIEVNECGYITSEHKYNFPTDKILKLDEICITSSFKNMQMHAVTYRRQILVDMGYTQTEGISYTDQQWIFIPMVRVKTVQYFDKYIYRYLLGRTGQTMDPKVKQKHISHIINCVYGMLNVYNLFESEMNPRIKEYLNARLIPLSKEVYVMMLINYSDDTKESLIYFDKELQKLNVDFYTLIGSKEISSFVGFQYINYWRKEYHSLSNWVVRVFSVLYLFLLSTKKKIKSYV